MRRPAACIALLLGAVMLAAPVYADANWGRGESSAAAAASWTPADTSSEEQSPEAMSEVLRRMGRKETVGQYQWQRRKSPKVAMWSSAALPGLGQLYNGRRLKTGLMVGYMFYYSSRIWINQKKAQRYEVRREILEAQDPPTNAGALADYNNELSLTNAFIEFHKETAKDFAWWSGFIWLIGVLDAWIDAHLYDVRSYDPPGLSQAPQRGVGVDERGVSLMVSF